MSDSPGASEPGQPADQPPPYYQPPAQPMGVSPAWSPAGPGGAIQPQAPAEPVLVSIGDISVTQSRVYTPSGTRELSELSWTVTDLSTTSQAIPTWAIVCAIIFFVFCLLGLLFLLVKETTTRGSVQVTVHGPGFVHTSQIPVISQAQIADINARVNYVRTLTASSAPPAQGWQGGQTPGWPQPGQPGQQWQQPGQGQ
jgi:hypothetical protein